MGKIQWKSDGKEDKFIQKLIKDGKINKFTKPHTLKINYPDIFDGFSSNVVRNHLNLLKRQNDIYLNEQSDDDETVEEIGSNELNVDESGESVPTNACNVTTTQINYPFLCVTHKNPDDQSDMVSLTVCLPGGAQNVKIEINNEGTEVNITYKWPKAMYNIEELFKKQLSNNQISLHHPKLLSLKEGLQNVRSRIDAAPESKIDIRLPIAVQTSPQSWTKTGITSEDGSQIIIAEFRGYINNYSKKIMDSTVTFEFQ